MHENKRGKENALDWVSENREGGEGTRQLSAGLERTERERDKIEENTREVTGLEKGYKKEEDREIKLTFVVLLITTWSEIEVVSIVAVTFDMKSFELSIVQCFAF